MAAQRCRCCRTRLARISHTRLVCPNAQCPRPTTLDVNTPEQLPLEDQIPPATRATSVRRRHVA